MVSVLQFSKLISQTEVERLKGKVVRRIVKKNATFLLESFKTFLFLLFHDEFLSING